MCSHLLRYREIVAIKQAQDISAQEEVAQAGSALSGRVASQEFGPMGPGIWENKSIIRDQNGTVADSESSESMEVMHDEEVLQAALAAVELDGQNEGRKVSYNITR